MQNIYLHTAAALSVASAALAHNGVKKAAEAAYMNTVRDIGAAITAHGDICKARHADFRQKGRSAQ